jgi:hypothetical protein
LRELKIQAAEEARKAAIKAGATASQALDASKAARQASKSLAEGAEDQSMKK